MVGHALYSFRNCTASLVYGIFGQFIKRDIPESTTQATATYYQQLTRYSTNFALIADVALLKLGGTLKRKERLSARLGDVLSLLYLCSATLRQFENDHRPEADLPLLHWSMQDAIYQLQQALDELLNNFPANFVMVACLRGLIFPLGKRATPPSDQLSHEVARLMLQPGTVRDRLTEGVYIPQQSKNKMDEPVADLEQALQCAIETDALEAKLREVTRSIMFVPGRDDIDQALAKNFISSEEATQLKQMKQLRRKVIMVDDFTVDFER